MSVQLDLWDGKRRKHTPVASVAFDNEGRGLNSGTTLAYQPAWVETLWERSAPPFRPDESLAVRYPPDFGAVWHKPHWPPFLLDLLPQGAARSYWVRQTGIRDGLDKDTLLLRCGASNPPGNVRVALDPGLAREHPALADVLHASTRPPEWHEMSSHPNRGFGLDDILARGWDFLDHARRLGSPVSGATGAQGQSPKFLLREDTDGRYHADLELPDVLTRDCVIIKFARPGIAVDGLIIDAEQAYYRVAGALGYRVQEILPYRGALVARRFDRALVGEAVHRFGLESLASVHGSVVFGESIRMELLCRTVLETSFAPLDDLVEFLARDALNIALRNTDNHARNTSFLKTPREGIRLAPLYDVAPMYLDPEGIARVCSFSSENLAGGLHPFPNYIAEFDAAVAHVYGKVKRGSARNTIPQMGAVAAARELLRSRLQAFSGLPKIMMDADVPEKVVADCAPRQKEFLAWLEKTT